MAVWLNEAAVRRLLPLDELVEAMEEALKAFSTGEAAQPVRGVVEVGGGALFAAMPALVRAPRGLGAKLVTVYPGNKARGLETHQALIVMFDAETGEPRAVMDGRYITEMRTAAVSALSLSLLGGKKTGTLAIVGTGVQAGSHVEMLGRVAKFEEVRFWSPREESRERFGRAHPGLRRCETAEEAVRGAGVVVLATSSAGPVVKEEWIGAGTHVMAVGACRPGQREMPAGLVARARVFVDSRAAAMVESGDILLAMEEGRIGAGHIAAEIGEVAAGRALGRRNAEEVTVFKSLGLAVEDVAAGRLVMERAEALGEGVRLS